jgi:hypothetical protein
MLAEVELGTWQGRCSGNLGGCRAKEREREEVRVVVAEKCSLGENARNGEVTLKLTLRRCRTDFPTQDSLASLDNNWGAVTSQVLLLPVWFVCLHSSTILWQQQQQLSFLLNVMRHGPIQCTKVAECHAGIDHAKFRARLYRLPIHPQSRTRVRSFGLWCSVLRTHSLAQSEITMLLLYTVDSFERFSTSDQGQINLSFALKARPSEDSLMTIRLISGRASNRQL